MRKKIIYTGAFRFPDKDAAAKRVYGVGKCFNRLDYDVIYAGWEQSSRKEDKNEENGIYEYKGFEYYSQKELDGSSSSLLKKLINYLTLGRKTLKWLNSYITNNDIYALIVYNSNSYFLWQAQKFCKKNNIKLIADCTEWYEGSHLPGGKYGPVNFDNNIRIRALYPRIKNIITISSYLKKYFENKNCNTIIIPPLITELNDEKVKNTEGDNKFIDIIYAGNPGSKDNISTIVEILNKNSSLQNIRFTVIGISYQDFILTFPNIIINENVKFMGRVNQDKVKLFYENADFSLIIRPNKRYANAGFPTKFVESLSYSVPVISTKTSDIGDYLKSGNNGFMIDSDRLEELEETLCRVSKIDKIELENMKKNAQKTSSLFNFENYTKQIAQYLETI